MIKKINITNYGIFKNFDWDSTIRDKGNNILFFKRLNILYGRNYSGKTTLSKIFRSIETDKPSLKISNPNFQLIDCEEEVCDQNSTTTKYDIRVYNRDFVKDNLKWLIDEDNGEIEPFAIVGEGNVETEALILEKQVELGSEEEEQGILHQLKLKKDEYTKKNSEYDSYKNELQGMLRKKANDDIKHKFNLPNYTIKGIEQDISTIIEKEITALTDEEVTYRNELLKDDIKDEILPSSLYNTSLKKHHLLVEELVTKKIKPTESIQDLLNDSLLQQWARDGVKHHYEKRTTCGFCQQPLPHDLWDTLKRHFNKESEDLEKDLLSCIESLEQEKKSIEQHIIIVSNKFYSTNHKELDSIKLKWETERSKYSNHIDSLIKVTKQRKENIFTPIEFTLSQPESDLNSTLVEYNNLVTSNNDKASTLKTDKDSASEDLRINSVLAFMTLINYTDSITRRDTLKQESDALSSEVESIELKVDEIKNEIKALELEHNDEQKGVEKVNEYLHHFFGDNSLYLEAEESDATEEETPVFKFVLKRNGNQANNLSEGECSLIAFCYFLAKLEDHNTKGKDLILWIDDPISSLDANHIFFVFSLIENKLAQPKNYNQLFISTHNLDLLKYLKKLTVPFFKDENNKNQKDLNHFLLQRESENSSIQLMPSYLKEYITEFNFLFSQIFSCYENEGTDNFSLYYNFGNNVRKFLEAYLYYKYPDKSGNKERMKRFLNSDGVGLAVTERITNELSHLEEIFDRSISPIDIPEIKKLAKYILKQMCIKDEEQLRSLLNSINKKGESLESIITDLKN